MNTGSNVLHRIGFSLRSRRGKIDRDTEQDCFDEIGRIVSSPFSVTETYEKFAVQVKRIIQFDRIIITVVDAEFDTFKLEYVLGTAVNGMAQGDVFPLKNSFVSQVVRSKQPIRCDPSNEYPNLRLFLEAGLISSIATPLIANEKVIGVLHLASAIDAAFGDGDLGRLERIGNQIAGAMASGILLEADQSRVSQLNAVYRVAAIISKPLSFQEKAQEIVDILLHVSMADLAVLWCGDRGGHQMEAIASAGNISINAEISASLLNENSASGIALRQGTTAVINEYDIFPDASPIGRSLGAKAAFATPIRSGGQTQGMLNVVSETEGHFNAERVALLTALADELGNLFASTDLSDSLLASREELTLVDGVARMLTSTLTIGDIYEKFSTEIMKLLDFDRITIATIDHIMQTIEVRYVFGEPMPGRCAGDVIPLIESTTFPIVQPRRPIFRGDLSTSTDPLTPVDEKYRAAGFCSSAVIPLVSRGQLIGSMGLRSRQVEAFGPREQAIILRLADQIAPAVENAMLYGQSLKSETSLRLLSDENAAMAEIGRIFASPFSIEGVYDRFVEVVQSLILLAESRSLTTMPGLHRM